MNTHEDESLHIRSGLARSKAAAGRHYYCYPRSPLCRECKPEEFRLLEHALPTVVVVLDHGRCQTADSSWTESYVLLRLPQHSESVLHSAGSSVFDTRFGGVVALCSFREKRWRALGSFVPESFSRDANLECQFVRVVSFL